jgi:hypothetical protein
VRKELRLMVFDSRVPRKIFGSKREEVTGEWRELPNEEFNDPYFSQNTIHYQIKKNEMGGGGSTFEGDKRCIQGFVGKTVRKRAFERPALRWEYNIRVDHEDLGWDCVGYISLAENREGWRPLVNAQTNLLVP